MKLFNIFPSAKIRVCILATLLLPIMFLSVSYRVLDPNAKKTDALLKKIAQPLDKLNIHVVQDWNSKIKVDNRNVIIAPLANWPARNKEQFTTGWVKNLKDGLYAGYVAMRYNQKIRPKDIPLVWNKIDKSKRIFISFTRADIKVAEKLRLILESEGYKVFTYIKGGQVSQSYEEVGKIMSTAGKHFVIDSYNSRTSQGVIAEALTHTAYELKYPKVEVAVLSDKVPHLVKYDENKIKFIDALVTSGIPIIVPGKEGKLFYFFDPSISNLGLFFQNAIVKINGRIIQDPQEFNKWTTNILSDQLLVSGETIRQNLPQNASYFSKEVFDNIVLKIENKKAAEIRNREKYMEEQLKIERNNEIRRNANRRRRIR